MPAVLKNPLLYKKIIIPIIGPIPNINKINLAEFFVCPNSLGTFFLVIFEFFFVVFFFIDSILH